MPVRLHPIFLLLLCTCTPYPDFWEDRTDGLVLYILSPEKVTGISTTTEDGTPTGIANCAALYTDDHGGSLDCATDLTALSMPITFTALIETGPDADYFLIDIPHDGIYWYYTWSDPAVFPAGMQISGGLYRSDQSFVDLDSTFHSATNMNFLAAGALTAGANYLGAFGNYDDTGTYTLKVEEVFDLHGNDAATATNLPEDVPLTGNFAMEYDWDFFRIYVTYCRYWRGGL